MANIFRQIQNNDCIFKNENALRPEYMPEEMPQRQEQMKDMAVYLQEAMHARAPQSMLLIGPPGTGKTTISKLLLKQLCEVSSTPIMIYINCWETTTRYAILNKIVIELGDMMPRRGIAADEISARLTEIAKREKRIPIIILDEVDRLVLGQAQEDRILYDLSRSQEALGFKCSLIAITNEKEIALKLDDRVRSVLSNHTIYFDAYTPTQLRKILKERAKIALNDDAYDEDVIGLCAAISAKSQGDARLAIHLLWASAKKAQVEGCKKITVEHVKQIRQRAQDNATTLAQRKQETLEEVDKQIIQIVKENEPIESGQIYEKMQIPQQKIRGIRNHLEKLQKIGLIDCEEIRKGQGRTRVWKINKKTE